MHRGHWAALGAMAALITSPVLGCGDGAPTDKQPIAGPGAGASAAPGKVETAKLALSGEALAKVKALLKAATSAEADGDTPGALKALKAAEAEYAQALPQGPEYAQVRYRHGRVALLVGETELAEPRLAEAIEQTRDPEPRFLLAARLLETDDFDGALKLVKEGLELVGEAPAREADKEVRRQLTLLLGRIEGEHLDDHKSAIEHLSAALASELPKQDFYRSLELRAAMRLGNLYEQAGEWKEAKPRFEAALGGGVVPPSELPLSKRMIAEAYQGLGLSRTGTGEAAAALESFAAAARWLERDPVDGPDKLRADVELAWGQTESALKRYAASVPHYEKALEAFTALGLGETVVAGEAHAGLAEALYLIDKAGKARDHVERALALFRKDKEESSIIGALLLLHSRILREVLEQDAADRVLGLHKQMMLRFGKAKDDPTRRRYRGERFDMPPGASLPKHYLDLPDGPEKDRKIREHIEAQGFKKAAAQPAEAAPVDKAPGIDSGTSFGAGAEH